MLAQACKQTPPQYGWCAPPSHFGRHAQARFKRASLAAPRWQCGELQAGSLVTGRSNSARKCSPPRAIPHATPWFLEHPRAALHVPVATHSECPISIREYCTSRGHQSRSCQVMLTCSLCHRKPATSMCDPNCKKQESTARSTNSTTAFVSSNAILRSNKSSCMISRTDNGVYLQTFHTWGRSRR